MRINKKIEWKDETKTRTKVKMVEKIVNESKVILEERTVKTKAIRMVKQTKLVKQRIPKTFEPVEDCRCHIQNCECIDVEDCMCAYPMCLCAPQIRHRNVEVLEEIEVPEEYEVITVEKVPKVV